MTNVQPITVAALSLTLGTAAGCYAGYQGSADTRGNTTSGTDSGPGGPGGDGGDGTDGRDPGGGGELSCETVDVGPTPLVRLTRAQYDNTIRDLLGLDTHPADAFPKDGAIGPFEINVSPVDELIVDKYMRAAEELAVTAVESMLPCESEPADEAACARELVESLGLRVYRRPLESAEVEDYLQLFSDARQEGPFENAASIVIEAMLQSPYFLYRIEVGAEIPPASGGGSEMRGLDAYEIATKLSYFLWNTMPDDLLLAAAGEGGLDSPEGVEAQAIRLLEDDRAKEAIAAFHQQWTGMTKLLEASKDSEAFPEFDDELRHAMLDESEAFVDYVVRQRGDTLETLLTADFSFPPPRVLELYGEPVAGGGGVPTEPVSLDATRRSGLFTLPAFLAAQAHGEQTSPVLRGHFVRESLLCQELPPPPPTVDNTPPVPDPSASTKERFEQHTLDPACAGCHALIDPIGWGFEHYDPIGRFREREGEFLVDARGELRGTADADGSFDGAVELMARLSHSEEVRHCYAKQWFRFATTRLETNADDCSLSRAQDAFSASDGTIRDLILALVQIDAFHYRRTPSAD